MPKETLIFEKSEFPDDLQEPIRYISSRVYNENEIYVRWEIGNTNSKWRHWLMPKSVLKIDAFLLLQGAKAGQEVLIHSCW